jgi:hypothetical protein
MVFHLPVALKVQNDMTFALSLGLVILICLLYVYLLRFTSEAAYQEAPRGYALAVGIPMFIGMLYFLNVLPAVPLSINKSGIYHALVREGSDFQAQEEVVSKSLFSRFSAPIFHMANSGDAVYFFSSINAPAELTASISHVWEYYDEKESKWKVSNVVPFGILGGRAEGYRAFSMKSNITPGLWRVTVKVGGNRVVGRKSFKVVQDGAVQLINVKL